MRITPVDPALAHQLIDAAQQIISAFVAREANITSGPLEPFKSLARQSDGSVRMQFTGIPGQVYVIEASTNLVDWEVIDVPVDMGNGSFEFDDPDSAKYPTRFYRVVVP
jgi:hypothetical protein